MKKIQLLGTAVLMLLMVSPLNAQKKNLSKSDYANWQNLSDYYVSDNGEWAAWHVTLVDGDDTLYIATTDGELKYKFKLSANPSFSSGSDWLKMTVNLSEKAREKMVENKKEVKSKLRLLNLATGEERIFPDIRNSSFSKGGDFLVMSGYPDKEKRMNITVFSLNNGTAKNIANVTEYSVNKPGKFLAYIIDAENNLGNGVELFSLQDYSVKIIDSDTTKYTALSWDEDGNAFSFLKAMEDTLHRDPNHILFSVNNTSGNPQVSTFNPASSDVIPENMRIRETYKPKFSKDRSILYFGVYEWNKKEKKKKGDDEKLPGVDIWHWKDDPIQPRQKVTYSRNEANFTYLFALNVATGDAVRVSDDEYEDPVITADGKHVIVRSDKDYRPQFRTPNYDTYIVDPLSGTKTKVTENFTAINGSSPGGKYLYYFRDKAWFVYDIAKDKHINLTGSIDTDFWNTRDDHPGDVKPPFGISRWYKDDKAFLVYDEFDIWKIFTDGSSPEKLTDGRKSEVISRVLVLDREEKFLDPSQDIFISKTGDKSKWTGFGKISPNGNTSELIYKDMLVSRLVKAKEDDTFLFTEQTYSDSPDLFVTGIKFRKPVQLSQTNPQQSEYFWGKSELVSYTNRNGKELQGALYYPANYEPGKKYPMIVYIYEIRSTGVHRYVSPSESRAYNTTNYTTSGYFVFQPDIVYRTNHPGESAVECVVPAVEKVIKTGMIDEKKIGLMGHSWGAYQTAFIITQTDLFSAAVAGAPLIDMISMYNEIYWNSGSPNQNIFETSQGRLREPWWDILDDYIANSPMFNAGNIKTPFLVAFGDNDGAVDWHQGIEMYTTMRRMEKPYIMLVYAGENHGLRKKENMKDYCTKQRQFFEHYLLGKDAEEWIKVGRSYMQKKKEEELKNKK